MENLAKAAPRAAAGQVVGARAVVVTVEASSAELEGGPAEVAVKAAISAPYLARTVAGTAWEGTEAAVEARNPPRSALGRSRAEALFAPSWRPSGGKQQLTRSRVPETRLPNEKVFRGF